jgi:putative DNA primase/helicase
MRGHEHDDWVQRARAAPIQTEIEKRGIKLKRQGLERVGACPKCGGDDRFAINAKKGVFNCRGCGIGGDVIQLVEHLDGVDFNTACTRLTGQPPPKAKANGKANGKDDRSKKVVVATFEYQNQDGSVAFAVDRIEFQKGDGSYVLKDGKRDKIFSQKRPDPERPGEWIRRIKDQGGNRLVPIVPYRLPDLIEALANGRTVFVVEGEAKADLLWSWNLAATCCAGGAKKWKFEHSEFLRGADVVLLPDKDDAGWEHINKVGTMLVGIADRIRVLVLPHAKDKDDIIDWANAGGTREQFDALLEQAKDWDPPAAPISDEEKTEASKREDELINALLNTPEGLEFYRKRDEAAKELEVPKAAIDAELQVRRDAVPLHGHWLVVPWDEPVDGDSLLRDIIRCIRRYVACTHDFSLTAALWTMFAWVHDDVAVHSPILLVTSAESESGKSTTLGLLSFLIPRAIASVEISKGALYRSIQLWQPSFLIDEFDQVLASASKDESQAELRSIINSGHTRGQGVIRCVTDAHRPELFSTFAPKAIGMVGRKMPVTTLSRCIVLELRRRAKDEKIDEFKHQDNSELFDLRRRLRRWATDNVDSLRDAVVTMPAQFRNRLANNWRVLFAIADLCAGAEDWGDKARLVAINIESASDKTSIGIRLLADIKRIFDEDKCDAMLSATLVVRLKEDVEAPWAEWNKGKGLTQNSLARLLGGRGAFGITSGDVHLPGGVHGKGYKRAQFVEAWTSYLPDDSAPFPAEEGF